MLSRLFSEVAVSGDYSSLQGWASCFGGSLLVEPGSRCTVWALECWAQELLWSMGLDLLPTAAWDLPE